MKTLEEKEIGRIPIVAKNTVKKMDMGNAVAKTWKTFLL